MRLPLLPLCALLACLGCASARYATEEVRPSRAEERQGAKVDKLKVVYDLPAGGEATLWSEGASEHDGATAIQVGMEFKNRGDETIVVYTADAVLARVNLGDRELARIAPVSPEGMIVIAPGGERTVSLRFDLPAGVRPQDVDGFDVRWGARVGAVAYLQTTPFKEDPALGQYDPLVEEPGRELEDQALSGQDYPGQPVVY